MTVLFLIKSRHKVCPVPLFLVGAQREWSMMMDQKQTLKEHLLGIVLPRDPLKVLSDLVTGIFFSGKT